MNTDTTYPDYSMLIDKQTHAFVDRTNAIYPDNAAALGIEANRQLYDAMCREFRVPYPAHMQTRDYTIGDNGSDRINSVPVREYIPVSSVESSDEKPAPHIVYLHGGGFVLGGLESHDDVCAELSARTGHTLTSVDYCLAPEHKHPRALEEVMLVMNHLWQVYGQPLLVCGDSAGANLAAAACHAFRNLRTSASDTVPILAQVLVYPLLGGDMSKGSYIRHAHSPTLTTADIQFYCDIRCASTDDHNSPLFVPLSDTDFAGLPPTVVISAECDPLSDDGQHYCKHIKEADGTAHWINEKGLVHGYLRARHSVQRAAESFDRIVYAIGSLAAGRWPY